MQTPVHRATQTEKEREAEEDKESILFLGSSSACILKLIWSILAQIRSEQMWPAERHGMMVRQVCQHVSGFIIDQ